MNYTHSSLKYVIKNLWYIVLFSVFPAICFASMANVAELKVFYTDFFTGNLREIDWIDIFNTFSVFDFSGWPSALLSLFSFFVIVFCTSLLLALIDKHMRIGKRTFNGIIGKLNDNILSTAFVTFLFAVIYEVWALIFSALSYVIFAAIPIAALQYVLFALLLSVGGVALLYVIALFYLWLPCMQITGFEAFEALRYSNQITEHVKHRIISSICLAIVLGNIFIVPAAIFLPEIVVYVVMVVVYTFFFMLFVVQMEIIYFDAAQLEREDLKTQYGA